MIMVMNPPRRFAIATHPSQPQVAEGARELVERLKILGADQASAYTIYEPELQTTGSTKKRLMS